MSAADILGAPSSKTLEVSPPNGKPLLLRSPSFREWYDLTAAHRQLDGKDPPADLIAKTIAVVLARPDGARMLTDAEASGLLDADPKVVMWLYVTAWETVLRNDDKAIKELEKN